MERLQEIKDLILWYLIDDINLFSEWNDIYTLDFLVNNIQNISSDINIDRIETYSDSRYQVSTYIKVNDSKWYSVILDHSFEDNDLSNISKAAQVILDYENEANRLTLNYKTNENIN